MESYLKMRNRFAHAFSNYVDYQIGENTNPRNVIISSVLLIESASDVLSNLARIVDSRRIIASQKIIPADFADKVNETISYGIMGVVNFFVAFKKDKEKITQQDKETLKIVVKALIKFLKNMEKITSTSDKVEQANEKGKEHIYYLFQDKTLQQSAYTFLVGLEDRRIVKILQSLGLSDWAREINNSISKIERNLGTAEQANNRMQSGVPGFDASKPYRFIAASEEI
jgi:hypothetical protein